MSKESIEFKKIKQFTKKYTIQTNKVSPNHVLVSLYYEQFENNQFMFKLAELLNEIVKDDTYIYEYIFRVFYMNIMMKDNKMNKILEDNLNETNIKCIKKTFEEVNDEHGLRSLVIKTVDFFPKLKTYEPDYLWYQEFSVYTFMEVVFVNFIKNNYNMDFEKKLRCFLNVLSQSKSSATIEICGNLQNEFLKDSFKEKI